MLLPVFTDHLLAPAMYKFDCELDFYGLWAFKAQDKDKLKCMGDNRSKAQRMIGEGKASGEFLS